MKRLITVSMEFVIFVAIVSGFLFGFKTPGEVLAEKDQPRYAHPEALASTDWLQRHLSDNEIRIIDCNVSFLNPNSYKEGHIPGAVPLDVIRQLSDPKGRVPLLILSKSQFEKLMGNLGVSNGKTVVVYDAFGGSWAAKLWWALMYYGHENVKILNGGLSKWKAEAREMETENFKPTPAVFKARVQQNLLADLEDVKQAIAQDNIYLVDALNPENYSGKRPFSPQLAPAGHIPTAINIPGPSNINKENGLFLSPDELEEHWRKLKAKPNDKVITYCGAGYYGAFDLFALYQLGYKRISLYDGSWMEWISDKTRPVITG